MCCVSDCGVSGFGVSFTFSSSVCPLVVLMCVMCLCEFLVFVFKYKLTVYLCVCCVSVICSETRGRVSINERREKNREMSRCVTQCVVVSLCLFSFCVCDFGKGWTGPGQVG